jgi:integrase
VTDDRRTFGTIAKLPSGHHRARYKGPDGKKHTAPNTFEDRDTAVMWLRNERRLVEEPGVVWTPPSERAQAARNVSRRRGVTFGDFAEGWLAGRRVKGRPLADRTRAHYRRLLDEHILPTFGDVPIAGIEPEDVDAWHAVTLPTAPTMRAHAYSLLRTILGTAADRRVIASNPAKIRGAGNVERVHDPRPATLPELETITANMPENLRLLVLLAAWCALRQGELFELRRSDVLTGKGIIRVRRGVVRAEGKTIVKDPKSRAGSRDVAIPPHLMPLVREHLLQHTQPGATGLLFPSRDGGQLAPSTLYGRESIGTRKGHGYYYARQAAGRTDLRFHDLRHTGAVLAAQTGATLAELMSRLGHSTPGAALRYQHAAAERDLEIARRLSALVGASDG